jgi:hypothetical protein
LLAAVVAVALGACGSKSKPAETTPPTGTSVGGSTYGGSTYGGSTYGGSTYGVPGGSGAANPCAAPQ